MRHCNSVSCGGVTETHATGATSCALTAAAMLVRMHAVLLQAATSPPLCPPRLPRPGACLLLTRMHILNGNLKAIERARLR